jgi:hypothetical protein
MTHKSKISWSAISELFPYQFVGKNYSVNSYSEAEGFLTGKEIDTKPHTVLADSWFLEDHGFTPNHILVEQCLPKPNYDSVLTVVWEE